MSTAALRLDDQGRVWLGNEWVAVLTGGQEPDGRNCVTLAPTAFLDGDGDYVHHVGVHTRLGITSHWPVSERDAVKPPGLNPAARRILGDVVQAMGRMASVLPEAYKDREELVEAHGQLAALVGDAPATGPLRAASAAPHDVHDDQCESEFVSPHGWTPCGCDERRRDKAVEEMESLYLGAPLISREKALEALDKAGIRIVDR